MTNKVGWMEYISTNIYIYKKYRCGCEFYECGCDKLGKRPTQH